MKRFWICLGLSMILHILFFPRFLSALMHSGAAESDTKKPPRVTIRMVEKKKPKVAVAKPKPKPKPVVKPKPKPPEPKPKPVVKKPEPPPKPKPEPKPVAKPKPQPKPPVAKRYPKAKPDFVPERRAPRAQPRRSAPKPSVPKRAPTRQLTRKSSTSAPAKARPVAQPQDTSGWVPPKPGEVPVRGAEPAPVSAPGDPSGSSDGSGDVQGTADGTGTVAGPAPKPVAPPPAPKPAPPAPKPEPPKPQPKRVATSKPQARKASIEVPSISLPSRLRKERFKGSLKLRAVVEADGSVTFNLNGSSGNADVDDYVLERVRKVAIVSAALDEQGQPKKSVMRVRVIIEVD